MGLFNKRKKEDSLGAPPPALGAPFEKSNAPSGIPLEQVTRMKQQGMSDNQIVQTLQRDGYKSYQVFDAMNQADLVPGTPRQPEQEPTQDPTQDYTEFDDDEQGFETQPQEFEDFEQSTELQPKMQEFGTSEMDRIEEVAEAIIDEKWSDLMKNINKIVEWKERVESKMSEMEEEINEIRSSLNELNRSLVQKMSDYDKNMSNVGIEVKAMEKVFQKMLPTFTENISELSRITKEIKKD